MRNAQESRPSLSIGLPVRNAEQTLATALMSVLSQTLTDWELLVLDDFSRDASRPIALEAADADARVRVLEPTAQQGLVPRLNEAVAAAQGDYFARMDADDVAYPTRFEQQLDFLRANPSIDLVGTSMLVFKGDGIPRGARQAPATHNEICRRPNAGFKLFHPTWMGRTEWFHDNPYRRNARGWEDQELLFRTFRHSRFANLPEVLLGYREDRIPLRRVTRARADFARIVAEREIARRRYGHAIGAAFEQGVKALTEIAAVTLGLEEVLRNRARPASSATVVEWQEIWLERTRQLSSRSGRGVSYVVAPPGQRR
jgi:glycosyltransferase involved in cell wall biosynthesis